MRKNTGHFLPTVFGVIRLYVWQIALLLLQQDLLTISIRAHGGESSQGMLVMEKPEAEEDGLYQSRSNDTAWCSGQLRCCLSDKVPPANACAINLPPISRRQGAKKTHREVSVEVVFPVEKRLPVYGTVESQSRHHRCLDTPFVQHLGTRQREVTWQESDHKHNRFNVFVLNNTHG